MKEVKQEKGELSQCIYNEGSPHKFDTILVNSTTKKSIKV